MNNVKYLLILLCALYLSGCGEKSVPANLVSDVDQIINKWVPVPEEGICKIDITAADGKSFIVSGETNLPEAKNEILEYLKISGYSFTDSIIVLPDTSVVRKPWGLVTLSVCNMRSKPAHSAELVTQALMGTPVKILKADDDWYLIQTPDSYLGWTNDAAITEKTEGDMITWKKSDRVIFESNYGVMVDNNGQVVSDLVFGDIVVKTGENKEMYEVVLPDGREGMIKKSEASGFTEWANRESRDVSELIAFGRTLMGTPYLWGGTSTKGLDCSGYAKTIYFSNRVVLNRDASAQYMYGQEVSIEEPLKTLAPGDLVFFGRMRDGVKRMTHVGMYIGNGEFIHESGRVKINSFDSTSMHYSKYLRNILLGAKRIYNLPSDKGIVHISQHNWYF